MNDDFVAEILRATGAMRAGDPSGATDIIQAALAAGGLTGSPEPGAYGVPHAGFRPRRTSSRHSAPYVEGEIVTDRPGSASAEMHALKTPRSRRLRKPLSEVLETLTAGRKRLGLEGMTPGINLPTRAPDLPMPEGAEFRDLRYACAAGARRYRLYVPASVGDGLQGLIVMLHGCTQNPEDFAAGTGMNALAEERRLLVVYPAQTNGDNSMSCWNWFRPGDQMRDAGEPAILAGLTRSVRDEFAVPQDRVFVAGLSAGGAMAAIMGETYPELYASIGVHSGLAYGSANDVMSAFSAMRGQAGLGAQPVRRNDGGLDVGPRVIVFHGGGDTTVHPMNAERIIASHGGDLARMARSDHAASGGTRGYSRMVANGDHGASRLECWMIEGAQHAWSGGHASGSYTDPRGPNASAEMVRFFLEGDVPAGAEIKLI
jgi:poly(hydroxyalkanoate) depolymerase family esterase